ncbi:helix-turn-helix domain-containing protein [Photorhabdus sp. RW14-46]|uniref:helix-turn-helix domain-containing protein n=1 Tax=Photorhabdus sp. RW14-46 TaxID=2100168 RepID=UPI0013F43C6C|nr:helix-turn-helix transcriptional regulator [Photorhabdus sp. RW14-46]NHB61628.1 transcriptional regulator [Photorhabdus sp. RW14-46]
MKVKGIPFSEVKAQALSSPKAQAAYEAAKQEEELYELIQNMKQKAGINSSQLAERLGVTPPAVAKVEKNPMKASIATLERYAAACGVNLKITIA